MSDIHILHGDAKGRQWSVVMHYTVPAANTPIGVSYRAALVASGLGGTTALADAADDDNPRGWEITSADKAKITSGELREIAGQFRVEGNGTEPAQIRTQMRKWYERVKNTDTALLQAKLKYFGHTESGS